MKLTNAQVFSFINIVGGQRTRRIDGGDAFALAMTKHALMPVYNALQEARTELLKGLPDKDSDEYQSEFTKVNNDWISLLDEETTIEHVPPVSIRALSALELSVEDAEFLRVLPFVEG
jgi:hypothetical protein